MTKLKMESKDLTQYNIEQIAQLFPQVVTEVADPSGAKENDGKPVLKKAIDFDKLKLVLSAGTGDYVIADDEREHYEFTWVGKRQSMIDATTPIRKTLRPCVEESKDWDTTENLYIEGDNLEALKLLQESYLGKVKMIYIDPPYNTGNDFVYNDTFKQSDSEYNEESGMYDEEENKLFQNTETNGRFHSDWCSMIYPRLQLARNLLTNDGVIFISIDDNETTNLTKICDEIFGTRNRIALICHKSRASISNDKIISPNHNTIMFYAKDISYIHENRKLIGLNPDLSGFQNDDNDGKGSYRLVPVDGPGGAKKGNPYYEFLGVEQYFRFSESTMKEKYNQGFIVKKGSSLYQKYYKTTALGTRKTDTTWWENGGLTSSATSKLKELMNGGYFDNPKPLELILRMLNLVVCQQSDSIILDFFSGSSTTAHAVMQLNAEDGGNRKFIMVQLPETTDKKSEAYKAGYKNICEIGKERIRRAGEKVDQERIDRINKEAEKEGVIADIKPLDTGFRVFKTDSTNMKDVYYAAGKIFQTKLFDMVSNIKENRSDIDLLYGCLLDWGVPLSQPHRSENIEGSTVHFVNDTNLVACFDDKITEQTVRTIASLKPLRALFRDHSFENSANKINVYEIFKSISPDTSVKVI